MKQTWIALVLCFMLAAFASATGIAEESSKWGEAINGLRMSLSVDDDSHELIFAIQSDRGSVVHLGENGIPVNLTVTLTTIDGKIRNGELGMSSAMHATGSGLHDNVVEILPKSTYLIRHAMDDFALLPKQINGNDVFPLRTLKAGDILIGHLRWKYQRCPTSDCRRDEICWIGDLASNTVQVH